MISEEEQFALVEKFFKEKGPVYHQFESYEYLVNVAIQKLFDECPNIKYDTEKTKYKASFGQVYVEKASLLDENNIVKKIFPKEARDRDITYNTTISVNIREDFWEFDEKTNQIEKINELKHIKIPIMKIPCMVGSSKCNLYDLSEDERISQGECSNDPGGYFIINGKERALVAQERMNHNQVYVFENNDDKFPYVAEIRSISEETGHSVSIRVKMTDDLNNIVISLPYMAKDVNVGAVFKALGFNSQNIHTFISPRSESEETLVDKLVRESIQYTNRTKAIKYISTACQKIEDDEDRMFVYTQQVIENELFPHMGVCSNIEKGIFLGDIINKLFRTALSDKASKHNLEMDFVPRPFDDRDNVSLKRIEGPCLLILDLLRMSLKRFIDNIKKYIVTRQDIVTAIKRSNNAITSALHYSFCTGTWSVQKNAYCLTEDSLVSLTNGTSKKIKNLNTEEKSRLISYNEKTQKLENDKQIDFVDQGIKKIIKLTFQDGRNIKCTPDHKFMIIDDEKGPKWVEAQNIPLNCKCLFGPDYPEDIAGDDENGWELCSEGSKKWKLNTPQEREKTLAFVRIIGFITSDGHLSNTRNISIACIGNLYDLECFNNDYELIMGEKAKYTEQSSKRNEHQFLVRLNAKFTKYIRNFMTGGNKTNQSVKLPEFILDPLCPKSVLREYLGGLFGGDGHVPRIDYRKERGHRANFTGVGFSWSAIEEHLPNLKNVFDQLQMLLKRFDIDCNIYGPRYEKDNNPRYLLQTESTTKFSEYIGFRYCINKAYKLSAVSCYWRMEENIKKQFSNTLSRVEELYKNSPLSLTQALEIARNELKQKEYVMNDHYSLLNMNILYDRRRKTDKRRSAENKLNLLTLKSEFGVQDGISMLEEMGCLQWFTYGGKSMENKGIYVNSITDKDLPYITMKLFDKRDCGEERVYDISVEKSPSFIANGCVVHNSRQGVSQIMSRLTYSSMVSHLRRVIIPVGKEGKNVKIRQIHPTQVFFVDIIELTVARNSEFKH